MDNIEDTKALDTFISYVILTFSSYHLKGAYRATGMYNYANEFIKCKTDRLEYLEKSRLDVLKENEQTLVRNGDVYRVFFMQDDIVSYDKEVIGYLFQTLNEDQKKLATGLYLSSGVQDFYRHYFDNEYPFLFDIIEVKSCIGFLDEYIFNIKNSLELTDVESNDSKQNDSDILTLLRKYVETKVKPLITATNQHYYEYVACAATALELPKEAFRGRSTVVAKWIKEHFDIEVKEGVINNCLNPNHFHLGYSDAKTEIKEFINDHKRPHQTT